ncbi:hypothetical protein MHZ36_13915 [Staphylococcus sp. ACRSN]|uniref:hypothetical protein n=1 Tax=Staphylococcus TaxID=1279 RepID=UPI0011C70EC3|nr:MULTISPECIES: hypothetical protein [Staphylococcus]MCG7340355.1 hypothetical protein [Staphylococcus sp. ACRSN]MEB6279066.1 hypothetical protein [Staphylococcus gallinarum]
MKRVVEITFTEALTEGNDVAYLNYATGTTEKQLYVVGYCAEKPLLRRFTLWVDDQMINLGDHLSNEDMMRMEKAYFDFRTARKPMLRLTAQLQNWYEMSA